MIGLKDIWENRGAILEGIRNKVFPREEVEIIASKRLNICRACEYDSINARSRGYKSSRIDEHCIQCGCPLSTKVRALSKGCPLDKWGAIVTDGEQSELENIKSGNNDNKEHSVEGSIQGS